MFHLTWKKEINDNYKKNDQIKKKDNIKILKFIQLFKKFKSKSLENTGVILNITDGVAIIIGLKKVKVGELIIFSNDVKGMVLNLENCIIKAIIFGNDRNIKQGDFVYKNFPIIKDLLKPTLIFTEFNSTKNQNIYIKIIEQSFLKVQILFKNVITVQNNVKNNLKNLKIKMVNNIFIVYGWLLTISPDMEKLKKKNSMPRFLKKVEHSENAPKYKDNYSRHYRDSLLEHPLLKEPKDLDPEIIKNAKSLNIFNNIYTLDINLEKEWRKIIKKEINFNKLDIKDYVIRLISETPSDWKKYFIDTRWTIKEKLYNRFPTFKITEDRRYGKANHFHYLGEVKSHFNTHLLNTDRRFYLYTHCFGESIEIFWNKYSMICLLPFFVGIQLVLLGLISKKLKCHQHVFLLKYLYGLGFILLYYFYKIYIYSKIYIYKQPWFQNNEIIYYRTVYPSWPLHIIIFDWWLYLMGMTLIIHIFVFFIPNNIYFLHEKYFNKVTHLQIFIISLFTLCLPLMFIQSDTPNWHKVKLFLGIIKNTDNLQYSPFVYFICVSITIGFTSILFFYFFIIIKLYITSVFYKDKTYLTDLQWIIFSGETDDLIWTLNEWMILSEIENSNEKVISYLKKKKEKTNKRIHMYGYVTKWEQHKVWIDKENVQIVWKPVYFFVASNSRTILIIWWLFIMSYVYIIQMMLSITSNWFFILLFTVFIFFMFFIFIYSFSISFFKKKILKSWYSYVFFTFLFFFLFFFNDIFYYFLSQNITLFIFLIFNHSILFCFKFFFYIISHPFYIILKNIFLNIYQHFYFNLKKNLLIIKKKIFRLIIKFKKYFKRIK